MVGGVSGNYSVTQTYTRNVEEADTKFAQKSGGRNLGMAPNQDIPHGTRGEFKNSLSFFRDSLKGFFEAPLGKKIEFLKDRIELRSIQKSEVSEQRRIEKLEIKDFWNAGGLTFDVPAPDTTKARELLENRDAKSFGKLSCALEGWIKEAKWEAKTQATSLRSELGKIADKLTADLSDADWKDLDLPALRKAQAQLRTEGRREKADLLGMITERLGKEFTQTKAEARYHGAVREYIQQYEGGAHDFWRNNSVNDGLELKGLIAHGFMNPFKSAAMDEMRPLFDMKEFRNLAEGSSRLEGKFLTEEQAQTIGKLADKMFEVLESIDLNHEMTSTLSMITKDIENLRPDEKGGFTRKFFINAIFLKTLTVATSEIGSVPRIAATMLYEAVLATREDLTIEFGKEVKALQERLGDRCEKLLMRFGMPEYSTLVNVKREGEELERREAEQKNAPKILSQTEFDNVVKVLKEIGMDTADGPEVLGEPETIEHLHDRIEKAPVEEPKPERELKPVDVEKVKQRNRQILDKFKF